MSGMEARRAAKAAAAAATATATVAAPAAAVKTPKVAAPKPVKKASTLTGVKGPMKSIQAGRAYKEWEAICEDDGSPTKRSVFDLKGEKSPSCKQVDDTIAKDRVLSFKALLSHLNGSVNVPVLGAALRPKVFKALMLGYVDQILVLLEQDRSVKIANLVTMEKKQRKARKARNPQKKGEVIDVPARTTMVARAARPAKAFLNGGI